MPTYEYLCSTCGRFEVNRPITKTARRVACPTCKRKAARQYSFRTSVGLNTSVASEPELQPTPSDPFPGMGGVFVRGGMGLKDVSIEGFGTGLKVARGGRVQADGLRLGQNGVGVENLGEFDGANTVYE